MQRAVEDGPEQVSGAPGEFLARSNVTAEVRPGCEERSALIEELQIEGGNGSARCAEEHEIAARAQRREAFLPGGLADRIVDDVDAFAVRQTARLRVKIFSRIIDRM